MKKAWYNFESGMPNSDIITCGLYNMYSMNQWLNLSIDLTSFDVYNSKHWTNI